MYAEGGWKPPWEPPPEPERRRLTKREESVVLWIIGANLLFVLLAPIGGATVVHAVRAMFG